MSLCKENVYGKFQSFLARYRDLLLSSFADGTKYCAFIFLFLAVTAFFQFGFQLRTGIAFKTYTNMNTSDWLGPYNLVMAPMGENDEEDVDADFSTTMASTVHKHLQKYVSRYVTTPSSSQIQYPPDATILSPETFDRMAGMTAINETIHMQQSLHPRQDPYAAYHETCVKGDIPAGILPQIQLGMMTTTTITDDDNSDGTTPSTIITDTQKTELSMLRVDFSMLSLPDPKSKLYNLWPSLKKHLGSEFPLQGPYCYGNDPKRAYAIQLAYDSALDKTNNQTWHVVKGCLPDLPCWSDEGPVIPYDNGASGTYVLDPAGATALVCYLLGLLLMVSLVFNCQLSNHLKRLQDQGRQNEEDRRYTRQNATPSTPSGRPVPQQQVFDAFHDLEEPLLDGENGETVEEVGPGTGAEETKEEAE